MLKMKMQFTFTGTVGVGEYLINYSTTEALAPFPAHQMFNTIQSTINNNTVNLNCRDVINAIIRSNDIRELQAYNGLTPVAFDTYQKYSDAVFAVNNPLGGYTNIADNDLQPRGAFYVDSITGNSIGTTGNLDKSVVLTVTVTEPLLVSPFIFAHPLSNGQGIYGVQNMNFTFNLASNASRAFRTARNLITSANLTAVDEATLLLNFISGHPSDLLPAKNVVPFYELPRYISPVGAIAQGATETFQSPNLQLNMIPDKLIIFVRKALASQTTNDPDWFLPIEGISINWNNQSGILSSASRQDLYRYSREAGYNGTWAEFSGRALRNAPGGGSPLTIPTTGSMLMLEYGKHIQISEDWYAPKFFGQKSINPIEISI
jgi:hypothetical protein